MNRSIVTLVAVFAAFAGSSADEPEPEIHRLAAKGSVESIKALLTKDPKLIDLKNKMRETPLHIAAHYNRADVVELLLKAGAAVNERAYNDFTPLHLTHDVQVIKLLAKYGADLEAKGTGRTALEKAAFYYGVPPKSKDMLAVVKALKEAGANYTIEAAVYLGDLDQVRKFLQTKPESGKERSLLRGAVQCGYAPIVKLLLDYKANPHAKEYGDMPMIYYGLSFPDVVKVLLDAGVDAKSELDYKGSGQGPSGITLLHEAASKGLVETAKLLVAHGLEVNAKAKSGHTPIEFAAWQGHLEMVRFLVKSGAEIRGEAGTKIANAAARQIQPPGIGFRRNESDRLASVIRYLAEQGVPLDLMAAAALGRTDRAAELLKGHPERAVTAEARGESPIHKAVVMDRREIMAMMLEAGVSPDTADEDGYTLLHSAALWGRPEMARLLIDRKAKIDAKDKNDATPLHESARCATPSVAKVLVAAGADLNSRDKDGVTPLAEAERSRERHRSGDAERSKRSEELIDLLRKAGAKK